MYQNPEDCPFTGVYEGTFTGLEDLDFNNICTNDFIFDVCCYWITNFNIDGIRFDNTTNYYRAGDPSGLKKLLDKIRSHVDSLPDGKNFSLTIEHMDKGACDVVNNTKADSYWDNALHEVTFNSLWNNHIGNELINALNNRIYLVDSDKIPISHLNTHDQSNVAFQAGARVNCGSMRWYKTQPYAIALFTSTAVPLVQAGTEFGEDYFIPDNDEGTGRRIISRPLRWKMQNDNIGKSLLCLYKRLVFNRSNYEGLRSSSCYPKYWELWKEEFNPEGYGIDISRQIAIYHRYGTTTDGNLQRFMIVLNFSDSEEDICVPFPENGLWTDLLSNYTGNWKVSVSNYRLCFKIGSNWGHIFFKQN
jgi:hypothetical protein